MNPAVDAVCRLGPLRTLRVGAARDDAPFDLRSVQAVPGATLAGVKVCVSLFGDSVLDAFRLWAVTASGARSMPPGRRTLKPRRSAPDGSRCLLPQGRGRTTTVAFLTGERATFIQAPGSPGGGRLQGTCRQRSDRPNRAAGKDKRRGRPRLGGRPPSLWPGRGQSSSFRTGEWSEATYFLTLIM